MKKTLRNILLGGILGVSIFFNSCNIDWFLNRDGNYSGLVIFAYGNERMTSDEIKQAKDELTKSHLDFQGLKIFSQAEWWESQAEKYNKKINIPLDFYSNEIKIPSEYIRQSYYEFKEGEPIAIIEFTKYLKQTYPDFKKYDFIGIIYEKNDYAGGMANLEGKSFFVYGIKKIKGQINDDYLGDNFAHEFCHLLGATDKYNGTNDIDEFDLMKYGSYAPDSLGVRNGALTEQVKITDDTAREIGWE